MDHVFVYDVLVPIIAKLVEHGFCDVVRKVGQRIEPVFVVVKIMVKVIGSPWLRGGKDDVWQRAPLVVSVGPHIVMYGGRPLWTLIGITCPSWVLMRC
jgi:hypothetical protein